VSQEDEIREKLRKLEKAFREGRISEETYKELKAKYSARIVALGLADPDHPARKEIDEASALADEVVSLYMFGGTFVTACSHEDGMRLASAIDKALEKAPIDLDLMVAKSGALCLANKIDAAKEIIDEVLSIDPNHFEARQRKNYWDTWPHLFNFPSWSEKARTLHPVLAEGLQRIERIQIVRDTLQLGLAVFIYVDPSRLPDLIITPEMSCRWEPVWSDTPHGSVVAHYPIVEDAKGNRIVSEDFVPTFVPKRPLAGSGYWLLKRLAVTSSCFIVVTDGQNVLYNRRYVFPEELKRKLRSFAERIDKEAQKEDIRAFLMAREWHMDHFNPKGTIF